MSQCTQKFDRAATPHMRLAASHRLLPCAGALVLAYKACARAVSNNYGIF